MIRIAPPDPTDWFTAAFWHMRRRKFLAGNRYGLDRVRPHEGGLEPGQVRTLGERLGEPGLPLRVYTGPDPAGGLARHRMLATGLLARVPLRDSSDAWPDDVLARAELEAIFPGILSPPRFPRPREPATLARLCTEGLAAHRLRRCALGEGFEVDLDGLASLPVREGLAPYGGRLRLGEDLELLGIEQDGRLVTPEEPGFDAARDRFEASLLALVTQVDHLLVTHLVAGGGLVLALREGTPPGHPLRQALAPFTFNSVRMNGAALEILVGRGRYFHRLFALTWVGASGLLSQGLTGIDLRTPPERVAAAGLAERVGELPLWEEALGWWSALLEHAERVVDRWVEPEVAARMLASLRRTVPGLGTTGGSDRVELSRHLAVLLFEVTVGHRHVGNVAPYVQDPRWMPVKVGRGSAVDRRCKQDLVQKTVLSFLSSRQHPPRFGDDVASCLPAGPLREDWLALDRMLVAWERGLDARNARRRVPFEELRRDRVATSAAV